MRTLGIDPGNCGGAALVEDGAVAEWWAWTWLKGKGGRFRVKLSDYPIAERASTHALSHEIRKSVGSCDTLVLEGLYVARGRGARGKGMRRSLIPLAEHAGELLGPLRCLTDTILRPRAQEWRRDVLGLPHDMGAQRAEEYAVRWARRLDWTHPLPTDTPAKGGLTYAETGAVCEAVAMAVYGADRE